MQSGILVRLLFVISAFLVLTPTQAHSRAWRNEYDYDQPFTSSSATDPADVAWGISWNGKVPYYEHSTRMMAPASVMKVVTALTSLRVLGPEFRFSNSFDAVVSADGSIATSPKFTLSSDPTWGHPAYAGSFQETVSSRVNKIARALSDQGVTKVVGPVDVSYLHPEMKEIARPDDWKRSWMNQCMATIPTEFTINGNCATLVITSTEDYHWHEPGVSTPVELDLQKAKHTQLSIRPVLDDLGRVKKYMVSGSISYHGSVNALPVHYNEKWLKRLFISALKSEGIEYEDGDEVATDSGSKFHVDVSSPTLREILGPCLKQSINLIADRLFLENGFALKRDPVDVMKETLSRLVPSSISTDDVVIKDGSGLVITDRLNADLIRALLDTAKDQDYFDDFLNALPVSGISGTLADRLGGANTYGRVFAKTGTLAGVSNLAGYFKTPDGILEPFAILTQGGVSHAAIDGKVTGFADQYDDSSRKKRKKRRLH